MSENNAQSAYLRKLAGKLPRSTSKPNGPLASAHWADPAELIKELAYHPGRDGHKMLLGRYRDTQIAADIDKMLTVICGSRGGKGISIINPLLTTYTGSMLVWDFQGELADVTAERRRELGQDVHILNISNDLPPHLEAFASSFNPLAQIAPVGSRRFIPDCGSVAAALVEKSDNDNPYWDNAAISWLQALIMHVMSCPLYESPTLLTVRQLLIGGSDFEHPDPENEGKTVTGHQALKYEMMANDACKGLIRRRARAYFALPDNTRGGVQGNAEEHTSWLDYELEHVLSTPADPDRTFDFKELKTSENGITIYLQMSVDDMENCTGWLRTMNRLALKTMEYEKAEPKARPIFLMDEFCAAGVQKSVMLYAGFSIGITLMPIIQDLEQLKGVYRKGWATFLGGVVMTWGCNDPTTAEWVEKRLGRTSVRVTNSSYQRGTNESAGSGTSQHQGESANENENPHTDYVRSASTGTSKGSGSSSNRSEGSSSGWGESTNWQETALLTGSEFAEIFAPHNNGDTDRLMLIITAGSPPIWIQRNVYFLDAEFKGLYRE